jgi:hypothetical protein
LVHRRSRHARYRPEVCRGRIEGRGEPTFFVNGDMIVGEATFEEFDKRIKTLLKN